MGMMGWQRLSGPAARRAITGLLLTGAWWAGGCPWTIAQTTPEAAPRYPSTAPPPPPMPLPDQWQLDQPAAIGTDHRVSALQADYRGDLWVASWQGVAKIDPDTGRILQRVGLPNQVVSALAQDRSGRLWVGTYEGLVRLDPRTGEMTAQTFTLPSNRVLALLIDRRGYLWVGTDAGLVLISPDQGLIMTTLRNLPGVSANALTLDTVGNLWVGTLEGLVQIDTASALIKRQVTNLPGTSVQALASSFWGTLWAGTPAGLVEVDVGLPRAITKTTIQKPTTKSTSLPGRSPAQVTKPAAPRSTQPMGLAKLQAPKIRTVTSLKGQNVMTIRFDAVNRLWVGTATNGLVRVNPFNGAIDGEIARLPSRRVYALATDVGNKLWVGTSEGLAWVSLTTYQVGTHNTFQR